MLAVNAPRYVSLSCSHKLYQFITFKLSWPSPTISPTPRFMGFPTSPLRDPFSAPLLSNFYLTSFGSFQFVRFLHLSSVSRNLRELLTEPAFLNQTTKVAVLFRNRILDTSRHNYSWRGGESAACSLGVARYGIIKP